jgi:thioredoxin 1
VTIICGRLDHRPDFFKERRNLDAFPHLDESSFDTQVLRSPTPVVVEFGATWCQPCRQLEPVLVRLGQEWGSRAVLARVDVDVSPNLAMKFGVLGVPTVILFKGGQAVARFTGFQPRERILEKLDPHIG